LPSTDAVLLRRAHAGRALGDPGWSAIRTQLRERTDALRRRGDALELHGREAALAALWLDDDPARALELARANLALQREPVDWWVALHSARRAGADTAWRELDTQRKRAGLQDRRLDAMAPPPPVAGATR
jgi:hypothetical protein